MRIPLLLLAGLALLSLPTASAEPQAAAEVHFLNPFSSFTTKETLDVNAPLTVTISGTFTSTPKSTAAGEKQCSYDAFYTYGDCLGKPASPGTVFVGVEADNYQPQQIRHLYDPQRANPPLYQDDHRYTVQLHCDGHSDGCGRMRFYGGFGPSKDRTYKGSMTVEIGDESPASIVVDFSVIVTGKPNVPIKGSNDSALVASRLVGSGHATFTKRQGSLLVATESKGGIVLDDIYNGGKRTHIELGIITGSRGQALGTAYSPNTRRLMLLLKVKKSNDSGCPESGFLTPTLASLTLIPAGGVRDQAVLTGYPATSGTNACKGHSHAWSNGSGGVTARVSIKQGPG